MRESGSIAFSVVKNLFETGYLMPNPNSKYHKNNENDIEIKNIDGVEKQIKIEKTVKKYKNIAKFFLIYVYMYLMVQLKRWSNLTESIALRCFIFE